MDTNQHTIHALLNTPPRAPAKACPNGVNSTGFEATTIEEEKWSEAVGVRTVPELARHVKATVMT